MSSKLAGGPKVAACVAQMLDGAKCGYVQWGWENIDSWTKGEKMGFRETEFAIPDSKIEYAISVLEVNGVPRCKDPKCTEFKQDWCDVLVADALTLTLKGTPGFYLSRQHPFGGLLPRNQGDPILLPQSEIAPWLAEIEPGPPAPGDPDLVMVERPGFYPVKILRPASFTEAVIRLLCRDMVRNNDLALLWLFMIDRIKEDETTFSRHLRPEFQAAWNGLMGGGGYRNHLVEAAQLREKLIAENRLPADLPCISIDEEFKNMPSQDVRRLRGEVQFDKAKPIFERFAAELLQMPKISPDTDIEPMRMLHRFFRDC